MTFETIKRRLEIGVDRTDLSAEYGSFVNEAIREICRMRSWQDMKSRAEVTVAANATTASLPADFKELHQEHPAITYQATDGTSLPCEVVSRSKMDRWQGNFFLSAARTNAPLNTRVRLQVYVDRLDGTPVLSTHSPLTEAVTFDVNHYRYLPDLADNEDSNFLLRNHPEMCVAKAKAIALETINDPLAADFESIFALRFREASGSDSYGAITGRQFRMGG